MLYIPKEKLKAVKKGVESYNDYKEICRINEEIIRLEKEEGKRKMKTRVPCHASSPEHK